MSGSRFRAAWTAAAIPSGPSNVDATYGSAPVARTASAFSAVVTAMDPFLREAFGNPSSTHRWGREARAALDDPDLGELAKAEISELEPKLKQARTALEDALVPRDEDADRGVILEVRQGTGGEEAALLGMLNSCAAGVTVVNIDNGFGAGFAAAQINRLVREAHQSEE